MIEFFPEERRSPGRINPVKSGTGCLDELSFPDPAL